MIPTKHLFTNKILVLYILVSLSVNINAQTHEHHDEHMHPKNEFGIDNSVVHFINESEYAYGFHVHYVRTIKESKFGLGIGYERIFDEHKHNTIGVIGSYRPIEPLSVSLSPGITFEDGEAEKRFTIHAETSYDFELNKIHLGPVIGAAYGLKEFHISLGIHLAFGF